MEDTTDFGDINIGFNIPIRVPSMLLINEVN
jgi:hypothetical protein